MKKVFKVLSVTAIVIVVIIGLVIGGAFAIEGIKTLKRRNDRINNSKTLSQYVEYHNWEYVGGTFDSLEFYAQDIKCDLPQDRDIFNFMSTILILDDYTVYETAFNSDKVYSNGQQCKQMNTDTKFKRVQIQNDTIYFVSEDNKYYVFTDGQIEEINRKSMDNSYIEDENIIKIDIHYKTDNTGKNTTSYFVLKNDGQIYEQDYEKKYNLTTGQTETKVTKETLLYSNKDYGHITDFVESQYSESKSGITTIVSDKGLFYLKQTSEQQYIDIEPVYEMVASDIYNKYKADIKHINANYIFTTDNNIIKTGMLCRDIDKEVK